MKFSLSMAIWHVVQRRLEFGELEIETLFPQTTRHAVASVQRQFRVGSHDQRRADPHHPTRGGQPNGSSENAAKGRHELAIGYRIWGRRDIGAVHRVVGDRTFEDTSHVAYVEPADALSAGADPASQSESHEHGQTRKSAAVPPQHETRPETRRHGEEC